MKLTGERLRRESLKYEKRENHQVWEECGNAAADQ